MVRGGAERRWASGGCDSLIFPACSFSVNVHE